MPTLGSSACSAGMLMARPDSRPLLWGCSSTCSVGGLAPVSAKAGSAGLGLRVGWLRRCLSFQGPGNLAAGCALAFCAIAGAGCIKAARGAGACTHSSLLACMIADTMVACVQAAPPANTGMAVLCRQQEHKHRPEAQTAPVHPGRPLPLPQSEWAPPMHAQQHWTSPPHPLSQPHSAPAARRQSCCWQQD